jgi:hypothetical protein
MKLAETIKLHLHELLNSASVTNPSSSLNSALRLLGKWRSVLIQNTLIQSQGTVVMQGPLAGMDFLSHSAEGCHIPKLLGCYEQPFGLDPVFQYRRYV